MNDAITSQCIEVRDPGTIDDLIPGERPIGPPGENQVLLRVSAAGVNRPDVAQRQGLYPPPPGASDILGLEVAGEVIGTGPGTHRWRPGDRVCALLPGGGYSRYAVAGERLCLPMPAGLSMAQAAALPETCFTVWHNLVEQGGLKAGQVVLVHGGSGGIGTTAIQIARAYGATVFATAGSDDKCRACESLGAERAFNYRTEDFTDLKKLTERNGADIIIDMVGGDYVPRNIKAAAADGRIIQLAFLKGSKVEVDLAPLMLKRLILTGSTLRQRPIEVKARIAAGVERDLWPLVEAGKLMPLIHSTVPLLEAREAHRLMESSDHIGKIVLDCE